MENLKIVSVDNKNPGGFASFLDLVPGFSSPDTVIFGARLADKAAGVVVASIHYQDMYIEYLGADASEDTAAIMDALLEKLLEAAEKLELNAVSASVMTNEPDYLRDAYMRQDFAAKDVNACYSFTLQTVLDSPLGKNVRLSDRVVKVDRVSNYQLQEFNRKLGDCPRLSNVKAGIQHLDKDISFAIVDNKVMTGCVLIAPCGDGLNIGALFGNGTRDTVALLQSALCAAEKKYDKETLIYVTALAESVESLVEKLVGDKCEGKEKMVTYVKRL